MTFGFFCSNILDVHRLYILISGNRGEAELYHLFPLTIFSSYPPYHRYIFICLLCLHSVNVLLTSSLRQLGSYFRRTGGVLGEKSFGSVYQLREKKLALAENLGRERRWKIHFLSWTLWEYSFFFFFCKKEKKTIWRWIKLLAHLARDIFCLLYLHTG